tara:strand:+ start:211 stop:759 length:549 start_codon:yes stop_codon:yes gene_type:complete
MTNKKSVWATLSSIDCSDKVEQKGKLTYLSWAWAWQTLMENYPDSTYEYGAPAGMTNDTAEVNVAVTVQGVTHRMWLPVMDNRNKSIVNPTTRDVSDARMRCLVKCIAMFGLGIYIYAGEDLPEATKTMEVSADQAAEIKALLELAGADVKQFLAYFKTDAVEHMLAVNHSRAVAALKAKMK